MSLPLPVWPTEADAVLDPGPLPHTIGELVAPFEPSTAAWSGHYKDILERLGFEIIASNPGSRENATDGEYHRIFAATLRGHNYILAIHGNDYVPESTKLADVLGSYAKSY